MTQEERDDMVQEAKVFALAAPIILPLLERRKKEATGRLLQSYRSGRVDNLTVVAEISVLSDIENEIIQKQNLYNTLEENQNGNRRK